MKNILVTGANKGIGLAVVEAILREHDGYRVLLGARDPARGEIALQGLIERLPSATDRLEVLSLDVSDEGSVSRLCDRLDELALNDAPPLYGLVNNAGRGLGTVGEVMAVNVHAIRRLCESLAPRIMPGGRIVNVTSAAGPNFVARCEADRQRFFLGKGVSESDLEAFMIACEGLASDSLESLGMGGGAPYGLSKACANLYTCLAAERWPQLHINACTPGFIETDLGKAFLGERSPAEAGMKSPAEGARVIMHLLFASGLGSGHYYGSDSQRSPLDRYRAPGSAPFAG